MIQSVDGGRAARRCRPAHRSHGGASRPPSARALAHGRAALELPDGGALELGCRAPGARAAVTVHEWRFFRRVLTGGDIGVGEAYMDGDWECSDLVELCRLFVEDQSVLGERSPWTLGSRGVHAVQRLSAANTLRGSRRNIRRHYDLSNDFFRLFLDDSMTYSAARLHASGGDARRGAAREARRHLPQPRPARRAARAGDRQRLGSVRACTRRASTAAG